MDATAGVAHTASKAASLLFLRVMFPDELRGSTAPLVAIGAMSLVGRAALATHQQRQQTLQQLKRRTSKLPRRVRQAAGDVVQGMKTNHDYAACFAIMLRDVRCKSTFSRQACSARHMLCVSKIVLEARGCLQGLPLQPMQSFGCVRTDAC